MTKRTRLLSGIGFACAVVLASGAFTLTPTTHDKTLNHVTQNVKQAANITKLSTNQQQGGMTVHFQWTSENGEFPHLYYENVNNDGKVSMTSPGVPMNDDGDGWYSYQIQGAKSADVKISVPAMGYETTLQSKTGEDWYLFGDQWAMNKPVTNDTVVSEKEIIMDAEDVAADMKVTVHCFCDSDTPKIYFWNALPSDAKTNWPGASMTEDGNGWYSYTFKQTSKVNVLFVMSGRQSDDYTAKAGEWWFDGSKWSNEKPGVPYNIEATAKPGESNDTSTPVCTPNPQNGSNNKDFREETIYFVITTRFYDGDKTNNVHCVDDKKAGNDDKDPAWCGDFKGLIEKLDYIKALGFSAIWITPVVENSSSYDFHGYHAIDFSKVDPRYESNGVTYQTLINEAHKRGIKIIQDIVLNHTCNNGESKLFPLLKNEYHLGGDASTNSVTTTKHEICTALGSDYDSLTPEKQYNARDYAMKKDDLVYRKNVDICYEGYTVTTGQFAGDCMELNTEYPTVYNHLTKCYTNYINMGVDAFRVDTVKHISRLTFNKVFNPAFKKAGKANGIDDFYMFGEVAKRVYDFWNANNAMVSPPFYTWAEEKNYSWNNDSKDGKDNIASCEEMYCYYDGGSSIKDSKYQSITKMRSSDNAFLKGNEYHTPDYSQSSGLNVIDYFMHFKFSSASNAFSTVEWDKFYNDATYNVVYVDSHDYGPAIEGNDDNRYAGGTEAWAENMDLMWTFRGIPCLYYGSEIEFKAGIKCDKGSSAPLEETGRAYYGDNIEGEVTASDYGEYTASGKVKETLNKPLCQHLMKLNKIRRAVPALQKGQYSTEGCNGGISFKRRYTDKTTGIDSYVLVAISGGCTFSGVLDGTYVDVVTGDKKTVSGGTLTVDSIGKANMRVYVLQNATSEAYGANGQIGGKTTYLK